MEVRTSQSLPLAQLAASFIPGPVPELKELHPRAWNSATLGEGTAILRKDMHYTALKAF